MVTDGELCSFGSPLIIDKLIHGKLIRRVLHGNLILPFADHFPKNLELYKLLTTKPGEIAKYKEEKGA